MKLIIEIDTDKLPLPIAPEAGWILRDLADDLHTYTERYDLVPGVNSAVLSSSGTVCGTFKVEESEG